MRKIFLYVSILSCFTISSCSKKENAGDSTVIPAENVINISTTKKAKAAIIGEKKNIDVANEKTDVWNIIYKDDKGNIHSTIIKQNPDYKNKIGDSIVIYYDESNARSLPIYEIQYIMLTR